MSMDTSKHITENERRRADNQIWNTAGEYGFRPKIRAYDSNGKAQIYWNSIIGSVHKHFGSDLDPMWDRIHAAIAEDVCEQLVWIGLENACYLREAELRPSFPILRRAYAEEILKNLHTGLPYLYSEVYRLHFIKALGMDQADMSEAGYPQADPEAAALLSGLEFTADMTGSEIAEAALAFLDRQTLLIPKEAEPEAGKFRIHFRHLRKKKSKYPELDRVREFGGIIAEHGDPVLHIRGNNGKHMIWDMSEQQSDAAIAGFVKDIFGSSLFPENVTERIERTLCCGPHKDCHLYFALGDGETREGIQGYAAIMRRNAVKSMERNRIYYREHLQETRTAVNRLKEKWQNAFLTYRQDSVVKSVYGNISPVRIWRQDAVDDDRIFDKVIPADNDEMYVDILIDASLSQEERQRIVALQAYIIAESLDACGVPVRVSSFCSLSGFTALTRYRDYQDRGENGRIFNYTTCGGNRDGLAVCVMRHLFEIGSEHPDRRILIILSDVKPNDSIHIQSGDTTVPYNREPAVLNTAAEIRLLKNRGVSVLCVYTGRDEELAAAHTVYNRDLVRIHSLDHFAEAVGNLMLTQIRG